MAASTEPGFFRLIILSPGQWDDEVRCTLLPFNRLRNGFPPYTALSYVWGCWSRNPPEVVVNGHKVKVTANLAIALRYLRHEDVEVALWIDALCIDQSNTEERSSQVAQMRDIYSRANDVIIFLGSGLQPWASKPVASRDLRPFHRFDGCEPDVLLASQYIDAWKTSPLKEPIQSLEVFAFLTIMSWSRRFTNCLEVLEDIPGAHMAALAEALRSTFLAPWWDRIWVVQEAVVANRLAVRYGNVAVPWELLVEAAEVLSDWESIHAKYPISLSTTDLKVFNLSSRISHLDNFRKHWSQSRGTNLLLLLRYFGFRGASDERDRVYALLGLCNEATAFRPDYSLQVAEVYMAPVLVSIRNTKSLDVLNGDHSRKGRQDIPSWVPDWSTEREEIERRRIELSSLYDACKGIRLLLRTDNNSSVPELIRDDIASLLGTLKAERDPQRLLREEYATRLQDPRPSIFHSKPIGQEIRRICGELAAFCHKDGLRELPKYSLISHSGQCLQTIGRKVGAVSKTTEPLYESINKHTAADLLGAWMRVAQARLLEYDHDRFLTAIFSDLKKMPDGSLRRLEAGDIDSRQGGLPSGKDTEGMLIPLFHDYDEFADIIRLSTTKRTMFFINDVDEAYPALMQVLYKQEALLTESESLLIQNGKRQAHIDTLSQHMKLLNEARLLKHSMFLRPRQDTLWNESSYQSLDKDAMRLLRGRSNHFNQVRSPQEGEEEQYARDESTQPEFYTHGAFRNAQQGMIIEHRKLLRRQRDLMGQFFEKRISQYKQLKNEALGYYDQSFFAKYGHMGMGPMLMKEGDEIYILPGSRVPLVLRPERCCNSRACSHPIRRYRLIGDCFIQGVMDGELSLDGFDILTIDDLSDDEHSWKRFNVGCGIPISGNDTSVEVGSLVALEVV